MSQENFFEQPRVGVAYNHYIQSLSKEQLDIIDYIEIPIELLNYDKSILSNLPKKPVILHCASLSLGGYVPPGENTVKQLGKILNKVSSPWLGEHISFVLAERIGDNFMEEYAPGEPYNIGFTMSPVMNMESVDNIIRNVDHYSKMYNKTIILENPPVYFSMPGSTMNQVEFINTICDRSSVGLLLDLAHFLITAKNCRFNPKEKIKRLPLHKVKEIHISGVSEDKDLLWDNHADTAPDIIFELLDIVLQHGNPSAVTLEYNWDSNFPWSLLERDILYVKEKMKLTAC
ncbi:MAG: DUF692 domain-containing protein [Chitinophagaceae bacterium]